MRRWALCCLLGLLLVAHIAPSRGAHAETVRLQTGPDSFGQGWLFRDRRGRCLVAAPWHVVAPEPLNQPVPVVLIDRQGRTNPTASPGRTNPELDLAFLTVGGEVAREGCSNSRVSALSLNAALRAANEAFLTTMETGARITIRVERRATALDDSAGAMISFAPVDPAERLAQGMSGGTFQRDTQPLAMLLAVDPDFNLGIGLRYDVIGREVAGYDPAPAPPASNAIAGLIGVEITLLTGQAADPAQGPLRLVEDGGQFSVVPRQRRISLILRIPVPRRLNRISVAATNPSQREQVTALAIETADTTTGRSVYGPPRTCASQAGALLFDCQMAPRLADTIRLTFATGPEVQSTALGRLAVSFTP